MLQVIGGWTGSRTFSSLVGSSANRTAFAQNVASFVKRYDFDGVDLDWEYPNSAGVGCNAFAADDAANFLTFLKLLRKELGSKYRLSAAVSNQGLIGSDGKKLKVRLILTEMVRHSARPLTRSDAGREWVRQVPRLHHPHGLRHQRAWLLRTELLYRAQRSARCAVLR